MARTGENPKASPRIKFFPKCYHWTEIWSYNFATEPAWGTHKSRRFVTEAGLLVKQAGPITKRTLGQEVGPLDR